MAPATPLHQVKAPAWHVSCSFNSPPPPDKSKTNLISSPGPVFLLCPQCSHGPATLFWLSLPQTSPHSILHPTAEVTMSLPTAPASKPPEILQHPQDAEQPLECHSIPTCPLPCPVLQALTLQPLGRTHTSTIHGAFSHPSAFAHADLSAWNALLTSLKHLMNTFIHTFPTSLLYARPLA